MVAEGNEDEPKLSVKLRSEIAELEPIEYTVLKPARRFVEPNDEEQSTMEPEQTTIEPEDEEERFEETTEGIDTPKVQERKPQREKAIKSKAKKTPKNEPKDQPISKLHTELRKHSDARKKTEREIIDIRKELKDLLLAHHATIKDLKKQVSQMHRKIATIEKSRKSRKEKVSGNKASSNKESKKKSSQKKSKKR